MVCNKTVTSTVLIKIEVNWVLTKYVNSTTKKEEENVKV